MFVAIWYIYELIQIYRWVLLGNLFCPIGLWWTDTDTSWFIFFRLIFSYCVDILKQIKKLLNSFSLVWLIFAPQINGAILSILHIDYEAKQRLKRLITNLLKTWQNLHYKKEANNKKADIDIIPIVKDIFN